MNDRGDGLTLRGMELPRSLGGRGGLVLALLLALVLRAGYGVERSAQPDYQQPVVDAGYHDYWARSLAGLPAEVPVGELDPAIGDHPCLRPPLYPWFLAGIYGVTGGSYAAPRVVQHGLGLLAVALVWCFARRALGGGPALLAALLFGLHWAPVYFEGELHAPALVIPLLLGMAVCVQALLAGSARPRTLAGAAGLLGGLAATARQGALLPLGAIGLLLAWRWWRGRRAEQTSSARLPGIALACLGAGAALGIAPATLRNVAASGEPVLITSAGGINLYLGNRAGATAFLDADLSELGLGRFRTCFDYPAIVQGLGEPGRPAPTHSEVDALFRDKAMDAIAADPAGFLGRTWTKALLFFGPAEVGHNKEVSLERDASTWLRFSPTGWFPLLFGLALLGLSRIAVEGAGTKRRDGLVIAGVLAAAYALSVIPFFAAARYRVPVIPLLGIAAGGGLWEILRPRARAGAFGLRASLALVLAAGVTVLASGLAPEPSDAKWHMDRGRALFDADDMAGARAAFEAGIAASPGLGAAHFELAITDHKMGQLAAAEQGYRRTLELSPGHAKAAFNLGTLEEDRGRLAAAVRLYLEALGEEPELGPAQAALGRAAQGLTTAATDAQRDGALAERAARRLLELRGAQDPGGLYLLAAAQAERGQFQAALQTLDTLAALPGLPPAMGPVLEKARSFYAQGQPLRIPR